ncbi:mucin-22-like [Penaeus chinensis]|uniref:mucin-22-like n=1 Tax=Penaeus chinensis TaxID=139456 RepID=UPI001FB72BF6|nr:mucin-22-like [Penaeus chinensis]
MLAILIFALGVLIGLVFMGVNCLHDGIGTAADNVTPPSTQASKVSSNSGAENGNIYTSTHNTTKATNSIHNNTYNTTTTLYRIRNSTNNTAATTSINSSNFDTTVTTVEPGDAEPVDIPVTVPVNRDVYTAASVNSINPDIITHDALDVDTVSGENVESTLNILNDSIPDSVVIDHKSFDITTVTTDAGATVDTVEVDPAESGTAADAAIADSTDDINKEIGITGNDTTDSTLEIDTTVDMSRADVTDTTEVETVIDAQKMYTNSDTTDVNTADDRTEVDAISDATLAEPTVDTNELDINTDATNADALADGTEVDAVDIGTEVDTVVETEEVGPATKATDYIPTEFGPFIETTDIYSFGETADFGTTLGATEVDTVDNITEIDATIDVTEVYTVVETSKVDTTAGTPGATVENVVAATVMTTSVDTAGESNELDTAINVTEDYNIFGTTEFGPVIEVTEADFPVETAEVDTTIEATEVDTATDATEVGTTAEVKEVDTTTSATGVGNVVDVTTVSTEVDTTGDVTSDITKMYDTTPIVSVTDITTIGTTTVNITTVGTTALDTTTAGTTPVHVATTRTTTAAAPEGNAVITGTRDVGIATVGTVPIANIGTRIADTNDNTTDVTGNNTGNFSATAEINTSVTTITRNPEHLDGASAKDTVIDGIIGDTVIDDASSTEVGNVDIDTTTGSTVKTYTKTIDTIDVTTTDGDNSTANPMLVDDTVLKNKTNRSSKNLDIDSTDANTTDGIKFHGIHINLTSFDVENAFTTEVESNLTEERTHTEASVSDMTLANNTTRRRSEADHLTGSTIPLAAVTTETSVETNVEEPKTVNRMEMNSSAETTAVFKAAVPSTTAGSISAENTTFDNTSLGNENDEARENHVGNNRINNMTDDKENGVGRTLFNTTVVDSTSIYKTDNTIGTAETSTTSVIYVENITLDNLVDNTTDMGNVDSTSVGKAFDNTSDIAEDRTFIDNFTALDNITIDNTKNNTAKTDNTTDIVETDNTTDIAETDNTTDIAETDNTTDIAETDNTTTDITVTDNTKDIAETDNTTDIAETDNITDIKLTIQLSLQKLTTQLIFDNTTNITAVDNAINTTAIENITDIAEIDNITINNKIDITDIENKTVDPVVDNNTADRDVGNETNTTNLDDAPTDTRNAIGVSDNVTASIINSSLPTFTTVIGTTTDALVITSLSTENTILSSTVIENPTPSGTPTVSSRASETTRISSTTSESTTATSTPIKTSTLSSTTSETTTVSTTIQLPVFDTGISSDTTESSVLTSSTLESVNLEIDEFPNQESTEKSTAGYNNISVVSMFCARLSARNTSAFRTCRNKTIYCVTHLKKTDSYELTNGQFTEYGKVDNSQTVFAAIRILLLSSSIMQSTKRLPQLYLQTRKPKQSENMGYPRNRIGANNPLLSPVGISEVIGKSTYIMSAVSLLPGRRAQIPGEQSTSSPSPSPVAPTKEDDVLDNSSRGHGDTCGPWAQCGGDLTCRNSTCICPEYVPGAFVVRLCLHQTRSVSDCSYSETGNRCDCEYFNFTLLLLYGLAAFLALLLILLVWSLIRYCSRTTVVTSPAETYSTKDHVTSQANHVSRPATASQGNHSYGPQTEIPGQITLTAEELPSPRFYYPPSHVSRRGSLPKLVSTLEPQAIQVTSPISPRRPSTAGPRSVSLAPPMFPGDYRFSPVETVPQRPHVLPPLRTSTRPPKLSDIP